MIYTFVPDNGAQVCIASARLRAHCLAHEPKRVLIPTEMELAQSFLLENAVDLHRALSMPHAHLAEPIILAQHNAGSPDAFLVDGHHRYLRAVLEGSPVVIAWLVPESVWRPYEIANLPAITQRELAAHPVQRREYWSKHT